MVEASSPSLPLSDTHTGGFLFQTHAAEVARRIAKPYPPCAVVDVRAPEEFRRGHIPGAKAVSPAALAHGLPAETTVDTEFIVVAGSPEDTRRRLAAVALKRLGAKRVVEMPGGMVEWRQFGLPLEPAA